MRAHSLPVSSRRDTVASKRHEHGPFEAADHRSLVTHTTFRRIAETLGFGGNQRQELGQLLIDNCPEQYDVPLWRIATEFES
ncbi:hypothetical protein JG491_17970 [Streptomyces sp. CRPSP2-6A1]|uniref:hypothetical protein n=1 Tax=Streptomyces sp. CRPSP2-6A1 TaxID=2799588 RepID=UPI0018F0B27C|nr:hypothetical protein [Streptomyces sp. CRPSP2-6A1]MBJ7001942.1 hypothetical protein [Streptomyces sp. CRPSP2-6A1]